jgi:hypothetical protein
MDILRLRSGSIVWLLTGSAGRQLSLQELETSLDVNVARVKVRGTTISIQRIGDLVVARFIQSTQVIPDLRNVGVQADSARVRVKSIAVLVDLVVEHTNRAPEGRVAAVAVDSLLVSFVCLGVFRERHVAATEKVPALGISIICNLISFMLRSASLSHLPALTDFSKNWIAFSWLWKPGLCWW